MKISIGTSLKTLRQKKGVTQEQAAEAFGVSPGAYLKQVRIDNASLLLRAGYCSVSEVAANCGFDSPSYFAYEFRRCIGMTPTAYRALYSGTSREHG